MCPDFVSKRSRESTFGKVFVRSMPVVLLCKSSGICIKRMKAAIFLKKHQGGFLGLEAKDIFLKNGPPMEFCFSFGFGSHLLIIYIQWLKNWWKKSGEAPGMVLKDCKQWDRLATSIGKTMKHQVPFFRELVWWLSWFSEVHLQCAEKIPAKKNAVRISSYITCFPVWWLVCFSAVIFCGYGVIHGPQRTLWKLCPIDFPQKTMTWKFQSLRR